MASSVGRLHVTRMLTQSAISPPRRRLWKRGPPSAKSRASKEPTRPTRPDRMAFTAWTQRPGPDVVATGLARDQAEQSADDSYRNKVEAPPCVACGQPLSDKDFERHRYEAHGGNEACQPW